MFLLNVFLSSCEKQESKNFTTPTLEKQELTQLEKDFIQSIWDDISDSEVRRSGNSISPENGGNPMDFIGVYYANMIVSVSSSEINNPSTTKGMYEGKFTTYLNQNDIGIDFNDLNFSNGTLYDSLAQMAIDFSILPDAFTSVTNLISFENSITSTSLLLPNQKTFLLSFSSAMKYSRATIANEGLTVRQNTQPGGGVLRMSAYCFDKQFSNGFYQGAQVLVDSDNPGLMGAAWVGLPGTIIGSLANGFWYGFVNC